MSAQPGLSTCVAIQNTRIIHRVHGAINLNTTLIRVDACEMSLSKGIVPVAHLKQVQKGSNSMITGFCSLKRVANLVIEAFRYLRLCLGGVGAELFQQRSRRFRARPPSFPSSCSLQTCNGLKFLVYAFLDVVAEG